MKIHELKEARIIDKCKDSDPEAQRLLYELYLPYVLIIVRRFGILDQDAPDVIQEIFIEVFVKINSFDVKKGEFKYWLKSIAIHKILNTQRKQKRLKHTLLFDSDKVDRLETDGIVQQLSHLNTEVLIQLVQSLPDGYRTVFNLYVIDNFSHQEISEQLGIDEVSSRSQLSRAKRLLRKKLSVIQKGNRYGLI